tara:strand:- start:31 stop:681 length:651 start_codon:yes stop_codon:yes gene_type:complete
MRTQEKQKPLQEIEIPQEVLDWNERGLCTRAGQVPVIDHYLNCLAANDGNEKMAVQITAFAIGESRMGVGITDAIFIADQNRHGTSILDRMNGDHRAVERLRKGLARNGYTLKSDDHYIATAALKPNDPAAILNHTTGLGGLKKRMEDRGQSMDGEIKIKPRENGLPTPIKHQLNPRIVERIRQQKIKENPDLARKDQRELCKQIIEERGTKAKFL